MKKVNFKNVLMTFSFAVLFLLLGMVRADAQVIGSELEDPLNTIFAVPQGNFDGSVDAMSKLDIELADLKNQLGILTPGTSLYIATERKYVYFQAIYEEIQTGMEVPKAIVAGLKIISSDVYGGNISQQTLQTLKNDAIQVLSL